MVLKRNPGALLPKYVPNKSTIHSEHFAVFVAIKEISDALDKTDSWIRL